MAVLILGFFVFATFVTRSPQKIIEQADGIVVLTGGSERLGEAARLLREGHAKWLLISGVNKNTSKSDISELLDLDPKLFACCVTLGYKAQNTKGNAIETRSWQHAKKFKSLIVVTASYHMPRSLVELSLRMPDVKLIPHSVTPRRFRHKPWWLHSSNAQLLAYEYVKFLPSAAQLTVSRIFVPSTHEVNGKNMTQIQHRPGSTP